VVYSNITKPSEILGNRLRDLVGGKFMNEIIYLDNAATTQLDKEVFEEMQPYFIEYYGNPSSVYSIASESKKAVNKARERVAKTIGALDREIYFTNGGTESDNWAIKGIAEAYADKGKHIITSKIEHHAVLHTCEYLEKQGYEITYLNVDEDGLISLEELEKSIRKDTILISIMFANNEIGTIEPIKEIGEIAKKHDVIFHTDAVQAFGHVSIDVNELNIDLLSASGHKVNGPKGVGFLYVRKSVKLKAYIHGGAQERQRRAGTENVPGIVGLGAAAELANDQLERRTKHLIELRDYLIEEIEKNVDYIRLNGHRTKRLPNNVNFCFRFIEGESLLISLDMEGICASSGSACTSGSLDPSHVLLAIGLPHEIAHGSLRLTLSHTSTKKQLDFVVEQLKDIVSRLRNMSPLYEDFVKAQK
jgi:cysteine desulfurase